MSATDVMPQLPVPEAIAGYPQTPKRRRTEYKDVKPVPFQIEEVDSVSEMMQEAVTPSPAAYDEDIMNKMEKVFFDQNTGMLYKLYINGTWEALKLVSTQ